VDRANFYPRSPLFCFGAQRTGTAETVKQQLRDKPLVAQLRSEVQRLVLQGVHSSAAREVREGRRAKVERAALDALAGAQRPEAAGSVRRPPLPLCEDPKLASIVVTATATATASEHVVALTSRSHAPPHQHTTSSLALL
jgi:hypothetical protein